MSSLFVIQFPVLSVILRYALPYVFKSTYFWILLAITVIVIIVHHNFKLSSAKRKRNSMAMSLKYVNEGRGGTVIYADETSSIHFSFEFGGANCVAIIFIPEEKYWHSETGRKLQKRKSIIEYTAQQALKDQVRNGTYQIKDNCIELYSSAKKI